MVSNYYCRDCDKYINQKYRQRHIKSKAHLYAHYNIVTDKYNIGDVFWSDFEKIIYEYMNENRSKFYSFSILVKCKLDNEDINISVDGNKIYVPLYKFDGHSCFCYKYCQSRKIKDYILHRAMLKNIVLDSSSIINNVTITIFSKYKSMTRRHRLQQPRRVLESKLLKYIKNASVNDKINKYFFLTYEYNLLF